MALMICGVAALCLTIGYKQKLIDYILKTTDSKFENYKNDSDASVAVNVIQQIVRTNIILFVFSFPSK